MEVLETPWHALISLIVFASGGVMVLVVRKSFQITEREALFFYLWHTSWCLVYLWYSLNNVADATLYYDLAKNGVYDFSPGTKFVYSFTRVLIEFLGVSYLGGFLVYNIFGTIGLLAFYGALRIAVGNSSRFWRQLAVVIVLLPSVSFWSSAIGKDSISFMAACLALWASLDLARRYRLMAFSVIVMFLVRPHIAGLMVFGLALAGVFQSRVSFIRRIFLTLSAVIVAAVLTPFVLEYSGVGDESFQGVADYMEQREGYNMSGGGGIDISSMSFPMKIMTYLFRPLPFEASSIPQFVASIDNIFLIFLFGVGVYFMLLRRAMRLVDYNYFAIAYSLLSLFVLAMTTANLGISMRQKWMFVPMLVFVMMSAIGVSSNQKMSAELGPYQR